MSAVENGESRSYTKWGITYHPTEPPYEEYDSFEEALVAFEGMKLKHQLNEHIVRVDVTVTEVYNGDHIAFEDAYGV